MCENRDSKVSPELPLFRSECRRVGGVGGFDIDCRGLLDMIWLGCKVQKIPLEVEKYPIKIGIYLCIILHWRRWRSRLRPMRRRRWMCRRWRGWGCTWRLNIPVGGGFGSHIGQRGAWLGSPTVGHRHAILLLLRNGPHRGCGGGTLVPSLRHTPPVKAPCSVGFRDRWRGWRLGCRMFRLSILWGWRWWSRIRFVGCDWGWGWRWTRFSNGARWGRRTRTWRQRWRRVL